MKLTFKDEDKYILILVKGDLTETHVDDFRASIRRETQHQKKPLLLNMDKLAHIDSHGFEALGSVMNGLHATGLGFAMLVTDENVHQLLKNSPYYSFLPVFTDEDNARHEAIRPRKKVKK